MTPERAAALRFGFVCLLLGAWFVWAAIAFRARWKMRPAKPPYLPTEAERARMRDELPYRLAAGLAPPYPDPPDSRLEAILQKRAKATWRRFVEAGWIVLVIVAVLLWIAWGNI